MFKEITKGYTPKQIDDFFSRAKSMGFNDDTIQKLKDGINS